MRFIGRLGVVALFLVLSLLYLDWMREWEALYTAGEAGWLGKYIIANLFLVVGAFLLEVPRLLSSRGRIVLEWTTLLAFLLPGLFLVLNPFWVQWGIQVSESMSYHLNELRLVGSLLVGLGIGKSLVFTAFEYFGHRSW